MIAQPPAAVLPFEVSDVPAVAQLATVGDILGRDIDGDVINLEWLSTVALRGRSSEILEELYQDGWLGIVGVEDEDDETPENRPVFFAAYVWLVAVANRWEEWIANGDLDRERGCYDLDWINWHRDLIKSTFQYFYGEWDFPLATSERYSGIAHRAIAWSVDDAEFNAMSALVA